MNTTLMNIKSMAATLAVVIMMLAGCSSPSKTHNDQQAERTSRLLNALEASEGQGEVYSLDPDGNRVNDPTRFHQIKVLGKLKPKTAEFKEARDSVAAAIRGFNETMPSIACFEPRHGLRVQTRNSRYDFVICFECNKIAFYDEQGEGWLDIVGDPSVMNKLLKAYKVPLAE